MVMVKVVIMVIMDHIVKEYQQRFTLRVREVACLILFDVSLNLRKLVLVLGNAIAKNSSRPPTRSE